MNQQQQQQQQVNKDTMMMGKKKMKKCHGNRKEQQRRRKLRRQEGKKAKKQNNEEPINHMDQDMTVPDDGQRDVEEKAVEAGQYERVQVSCHLCRNGVVIIDDSLVLSYPDVIWKRSATEKSCEYTQNDKKSMVMMLDNFLSHVVSCQYHNER